MSTKKIMWIKVNPDFDILFRLMDSLIPDNGRRYLVKASETDENDSSIEEDKGQIGVEVKTFAHVSHNALTRVEEYVQ